MSDLSTDNFNLAVKLAEVMPVPAPSQTVYFVSSGNGRIKIGISIDVEKRIKTLECAVGEKLSLLATIGGGRTVEAFLHDYFAENRLVGEWFDLSDRLRSFIAEKDAIAQMVEMLAGAKGRAVAELKFTESESRRIEELHRGANVAIRLARQMQREYKAIR